MAFMICLQQEGESLVILSCVGLAVL